MTRFFPRSRERETAWRIGIYSLLGALVLVPFVAMLGEHTLAPRFTKILNAFSIMLESVCMLPQLVLLRQTTVPTVIDSYYLLALGSYRALYICNWIWRGARDPIKPKAVPILFGIVQTAIYLDFAWVYYSRQRIKLRSGGIVDSDDLRKSWVLRRLLGRAAPDGADADAEARAPLDEAAYEGRTAQGVDGWGVRGISVNAEDTSRTAPDARMRDPDELARELEDDDEEEGEEAVDAARAEGEWREGRE